MNFIVYFLTLLDQAIIGVFFYSQISRLKKGPFLPIMIWIVLYAVTEAGFKAMENNAPTPTMQTIFRMLLHIPVLLMFEGTFLKKSFMYAGFMFIQAVTEAVSLITVCFLFHKKVADIYIFHGDNIFASVGRVFAVDFMFFYTFGLLFLLKFKHIRRNFLIRDVFMLLGFDVIHIIYLCLYYTDQSNNLNEVNNVIQFGMQSLLIIMMFYQFYSGREVRRLEKAKHKVESLKKIRAQELEYYRAAEEKYTEISMIRHDIVNHLTAVEALARQPGGKPHAEKLLNEIKLRTYSVTVPNEIENDTQSNIVQYN